MGDDWQHVDDDFEFDDPDYIYAEESWELADELASNALPQVPWFDLLDDAWDDYDMYDYFEELEYGNDDYYDKEEPPKEEQAQLGDKRKRGKAGQGKSLEKRRRLVDFDYAPVRWMPVEEAYNICGQDPVDVKKLPSYALLPDWKERFKHADGFPTASATGMENQRDMDEEEGDWEDEEDNDEDDEEAEHDQGEDGEMDQGLDPDILKTILAAKMAESGLSGADQGAFMQSLMQMISGGGADDAALEQLTSKLLGGVEEGSADASLTQWLSKEGVSLVKEGNEEEEGEEEEDDRDTTQPEASKKKTLPETDSPKDSVTEAETAKSNNLRSSRQPLPPTSVSDVASAVSKKRKKVSFAPPDDTVEEQEKDLSLASQPTSKRPKRNAAQPIPTPPPKMSTGKLRSIKSKAPPAPVVVAPEGSTFDIENNLSPKMAASKLSGTKEDTVEQSASEPKVTRKRKAPIIQDSILDEQPKKQLRGGFAAPTASSSRKVSEPLKGKALEPVKKITRSGKEKK